MGGGAEAMPTDESAFVAKIQEQIKLLRNEENGYVQLRVYVSGIDEAWAFWPDDDLKVEGDELLVVRVGPTNENEDEGVEIVFPIRHIVATELAVNEE